MKAVRASAPARAPAQRLRALGSAYVQYMLRNPAHLRVMFSPELADKSRYPQLARAAGAVHATLVEQIAALQRAGLVVRGDPVGLSFTAWSMVHGCAVLLVDGQAAGASPPTLIDVALRSLYLGLAPRAPARRLRSV
jgi:hypothetical protein